MSSQTSQTIRRGASLPNWVGCLDRINFAQDVLIAGSHCPHSSRFYLHGPGTMVPEQGKGRLRIERRRGWHIATVVDVPWVWHPRRPKCQLSPMKPYNPYSKRREAKADNSVSLPVGTKLVLSVKARGVSVVFDNTDRGMITSAKLVVNPNHRGTIYPTGYDT